MGKKLSDEERMARDITIGIATSVIVEGGVDMMIKSGVEYGIIKSGGGKGVAKHVISRRMAEIMNNSVISRMQKFIQSLVSKKTADVVEQTSAKVATTTAKKSTAKAGQKAAAQGTSQLATKAVAYGAAASTVVGVLWVIWDVMNIMWDLMDFYGILIVFDEPMLDNIRDTIADAFNEAFAKYDTTGDGTKYLDTEVFFDPLSLVYSVDENGELYATPEWGPMYNNFLDEYMVDQKGYSKNWRDKLEGVEFKKMEDYSDYFEELDLSSLQSSTENSVSGAGTGAGRGSASVGLILFIFVICLLVAAVATQIDWKKLFSN